MHHFYIVDVKNSFILEKGTTWNLKSIFGLPEGRKNSYGTTIEEKTAKEWMSCHIVNAKLSIFSCF